MFIVLHIIECKKELIKINNKVFIKNNLLDHYELCVQTSLSNLVVYF